MLQSARVDKTESAEKEAIEIISLSDVHWPHLLELACVHSIHPPLEQLLKQLPSGIVPSFVTETLEDATRENLLRQLRSLSAFFEVREMLNAKGITVIPFKGPWLAHHYYGDISYRESYDLDLFIDVRDLEAVKRIMTENGYVNTSLIKSLNDDYVREHLCEYNFDKFDGGTCIQHLEFHWSSSLRHFRMNIKMVELQPQIVQATFQGKDIEVFSAAAEMLLTVMHHGGKEQYAYLKQADDIAHILMRENEIDWPWLIEKCRKYRLETVMLTGVRQANILTGVNIPEVIREKATSGRITRLARGRIRMLSYPAAKRMSFGYTLRGWLFHIRSRDGADIRLHLAWHTLRKVIMPRMIPERWRYLFFDKKIRKK